MRYLWALLIIPAVLTYGAVYSSAQHWSGGRFSHLDNGTCHLMAVEWAIFPPMWFLAPIITDGYKDGFEWRHHHGHWCKPGAFGMSYDSTDDWNCEAKSY